MTKVRSKESRYHTGDAACRLMKIYRAGEGEEGLSDGVGASGWGLCAVSVYTQG